VAEKPEFKRRMSETFEHMQLKLKTDNAKDVIKKSFGGIISKFNKKEKDINRNT
jgi:hypothetical protein